MSMRPVSGTKSVVLRTISITCMVVGLAAISFSVLAQTTNPPAQPSDWEKPSGPYAVAMEEDQGISGHTIYRPADLSAFSKQERLPIVAFAGPGCDSNGTAFRPFFTEVASHGYLLIASGFPEPKGGSGPDFPKTKPEDLKASLDWAVAENARTASKYYQRLDTSAIAVMGQSCGGAQSLSISSDARIRTIVMWNSCSFQFIQGRGPAPTFPGRGPMPMPPAGGPGAGGPPAQGGMPMPAGGAAAGGPPRPMGIPVPKVAPEMLTALHVPIAYFMGGQRDMLYAPATGDIDLYEAAPLFWASTDLTGDAHAGTFRQKNGGKFGVVGVAWLDWQLKGDQEAAKMFKGATCGLCGDPQWEVHKKRID